MKRLAILFSGSVILVVLFQNTHVVSLKILWWEINLPKIVFFLLLVGLGLMIGFVLGKRA